MVINCFSRFKFCTKRVKNRLLRTEKCKLNGFFSSLPHNIMSISILGELIQPLRKKRYNLVITDYFWRLVRIVALVSIVIKGFQSRSIRTGSLRTVHTICYFLKTIRKEFKERFFLQVCTVVGVDNLSRPKYHLLSSGQRAMLKQEILLKIYHYCQTHLKSWGLYEYLRICGYRTQEYRINHCTAFQLCLTWSQPALVRTTTRRNARLAQRLPSQLECVE